MKKRSQSALAEAIPLEDELGDVLDKAICLAGCKADEVAARSRVEPSRLRDAMDWRSELDCGELARLAAVLELNEVGLCALAGGSYPLPEIGGLPFRLHALHMPHGIGVANAYIVSSCCGERGVLFDTGPGMAALQAVWPSQIRALDAIFLTHIEPEHAGGLCEVAAHFGVQNVFFPEGARAPCGGPIADSASWECEYMKVTAISTPGHSASHNCYSVQGPCACKGRPLLVSGDLVFAGSIGCAFHSPDKLVSSVRRVLRSSPENSILAPGHGPLTTVANELRYNPFVS